MTRVLIWLFALFGYTIQVEFQAQVRYAWKMPE